MCVVRHVAVSPQTCETTDKFRIHMFEEGSAEVRHERELVTSEADHDNVAAAG